MYSSGTQNTGRTLYCKTGCMLRNVKFNNGRFLGENMITMGNHVALSPASLAKKKRDSKRGRPGNEASNHGDTSLHAGDTD